MRKVKVKFWEKQIVWNQRAAELTTKLTDEEIEALEAKQLDSMGNDEIVWSDIESTIYDEVIEIRDMIIIEEEE